MRILCTNQALDRRGGTESYLQVVVPQLRLLGHDVELFCLRAGPVASGFRRDGFVVHEAAADLRDDYDVVHAQHASTALAARARLPDTPIVFVSHSWFLPIEDPPPEVAPGALVAFNDRVEKRLRASAVGEMVPVHRLTQPVAVSLDVGRVPIRRRPRRAVVVSRSLTTRLPPLSAACRARGIELEVVGTADREVDDPEPAMMRADIVFASGRTVLEAMSLARAACVYDEPGLGGWVTADSYAALEANGFTPTPLGGDSSLESLLSEYDPALGALGRSLATDRHAAAVHAVELVNIYRRAVPAWEPRPAAELERLAELTQELFETHQRARATQWHLVAAERHIARIYEELDTIWRSTSWRITAPLRRLRRGTREDASD